MRSHRSGLGLGLGISPVAVSAAADAPAAPSLDFTDPNNAVLTTV
jgi:hypothetical protein